MVDLIRENSVWPCLHRAASGWRVREQYSEAWYCASLQNALVQTGTRVSVKVKLDIH